MREQPKVNHYVKEAFSIRRFIVSVGWSIHPLVLLVIEGSLQYHTVHRLSWMVHLPSGLLLRLPGRGQLTTGGQYVREAFSSMRFIVSAGWSIYSLGYFFGYLAWGS